MVFEPDEHTCLHQYAWTRDRLAARHTGRRGQPGRDRHPGQLAARTGGGHSPGDQHRDRRTPTTPATRSFWTPADSTLRRGCCAAPARRRAGPDQVAHRRSSTPKTSRCTSISSPPSDGTSIPYFVVRPGEADGPRPDAARRLRRIRDLRHAGLQRRARPAVAGARRHLRAGQHPRRRRVRARLAHPGDARGPAPGRRGLRRGGSRSGGARHHHRRRSSARRAAATAGC